MRLLFFILLAMPAFSQSPTSIRIDSASDSQQVRIELVEKGDELRNFSSEAKDQEKQERRKWYVRIAFIVFLIIIMVAAFAKRRKLS